MVKRIIKIAELPAFEANKRGVVRLRHDGLDGPDGMENFRQMVETGKILICPDWYKSRQMETQHSASLRRIKTIKELSSKLDWLEDQFLKLKSEFRDQAYVPALIGDLFFDPIVYAPYKESNATIRSLLSYIQINIKMALAGNDDFKNELISNLFDP